MDTPTQETASEGSSTNYSAYFDDIDVSMIETDDFPESANSVAPASASPDTLVDSQVLGKRAASPTSPFDPYAKRVKLSNDSGDTDRPLESTASGSHDLSESPPLPTPDPYTEPILHLPEEPYIIAHHRHLTKCMETRGLPWGVQWEILRLVSSGKLTWDKVTPEQLDKLKAAEGVEAPNANVAPGVEDFFLHNIPISTTRRMSNEHKAHAPWKELDKELLALDASRFGCLGIETDNPVVAKDSSWYGGKVQFAAKISLDGSQLRTTLEQPELGSSSRFTRRFGSDWLIRVRIGKEILKRQESTTELEKLLLRPFILNRRVYRFFYANKERNVFLSATNEKYERGEIKISDSMNRMSLLEFLSWHNPMKSKPSQSVAKWAARMALGLSNSVPGVLLSPQNIREIPETISSSFRGVGKPPSEMEMTDGCGLINLRALFALREKDLWNQVPTAIQCRINGAKGLLLRHPGKEENKCMEPCVWIRPSQIKINYPEGVRLDPSQVTIDVLRPSHMRSPVRLSKEALINLSENGVPHTVFENLIKLSLQDVVSTLTEWDGDGGLIRLWDAVSKEGGIVMARMAREASGTARVRGLRAYDREDDNDDEDGDDEDGGHGAAQGQKERSAAWWGDEISGCPSSLEETVVTFLDSGFTPSNNPILAAKLHEVVKKAIRSHVSRCRIIVPMACSAHIVPDPFGVLEEGEIHVKTSTHNLRMPDGQLSDKIVGDVLVTRNPCKLPTDVQKVRAVFRPELDDYPDVIVFSVKGSRSLASLLGGGDYDGDKVEVIWQPEIVAPFQNADIKFASTPPGFDELFQEANQTVGDFLKEVSTSSTAEHMRRLQTVLMRPLRDPFLVGAYSAMHDNAMYTLGYSNAETVRLAWMFCTVLDGAKTGLTVKREVYDGDQKKYAVSRQPEWKILINTTAEEQKIARNELPLSRPRKLGHFIMDKLQASMFRQRDEHLKQVEDLFTVLKNAAVLDKDLIAPWQDAMRRAELVGEAMVMELDIIKTHVEAARVQHNDEHNPKGKAAGGGAARSFTDMRIQRRQDVLRGLSRHFASVPAAGTTVYFSDKEVRSLRASYAYMHDWQIKATRFPWNMAMRELGAIKAQASGAWKAVSSQFYDRFQVRRGW